MPFRSYLYLDEATVDDYLSEAEGGVLNGPYTATDTTSKGKEGGISAKLPGVDVGLSGKRDSSSSREVERTILDTPQSKFARLYKMLTEADGVDPADRLQVLNGFDQPVYNSIRVGEIVEVRGQARLPNWEHFVESFAEMLKLAELMKAVGQDPMADPNVRTTMEGLSMLTSMKATGDTVLIVEPIGSAQYRFVAKLKANSLRRDKADLEAEVTLLGKVQRRLAKPSESIDVFTLSNLKGLEVLAKRQPQKGPRGKVQTPKLTTELDEKVKYPAVEVTPIAIYI